jgi:hypothetical protein
VITVYLLPPECKTWLQRGASEEDIAKEPLLDSDSDKQ